MNKLLKHGNAKLHNTLVFSLPAGKAVCGMECPNYSFKDFLSSIRVYLK